MINKKVEQAINKQINAELFSSYLYISMAAWFEAKNLKGFANWMRVQAQEEIVHAMKFFNFVIDRGGKAIMTAIDAPKVNWKNSIEIYHDALKHEQKVTSLINNLLTLAEKENDHASSSLLQWFVDEQVEEEASASDMLEQLKLVNGRGSGLFILDREARQRVFTPPVDTTQ
ncbi:ferritin [Fibrobacterota bacterium]